MKRKHVAGTVNRGQVVKFADGKFHRVSGVMNFGGVVTLHGRTNGQKVIDFMSVRETDLVERRRNV